MAKITTPSDLTSITDVKDFMRSASQLLNNIIDILNGKITFDDNVVSQTIQVKFNSSSTDQVIQHNLNKTGVNFIVVNKPVTCDVFHGFGTDTKNTIVLQCTAVTTVTFILI